MVENVGPTWHNITIGKSTADQVILELGAPATVDHTSTGDVYYYKSNTALDWAAHQIVFRGDVVDRIEEDMFVYHPAEVHLTQFIDQYGSPDRVAWSMEAPTERVLVFSSQGVLVNATALSLDKAQVTRAYYFRPRSLTEIQQEFSTVFSFVNPFPNSDVVGPENPWESALKTYHLK